MIPALLLFKLVSRGNGHHRCIIALLMGCFLPKATSLMHNTGVELLSERLDGVFSSYETLRRPTIHLFK